MKYGLRSADCRVSFSTDMESRRRSLFGLFLMLIFIVAGCRGERASERQPVVVFAAASLTDALGAVADSFETVYPDYDVVLNLAATSLLARQIDQGARADVFFSASVAWMVYLEGEGRVAGSVVEPLENRLVVVGPKGSARLTAPADLMQKKRLALADPESVPAGIYAKEALVCAGLWEGLASHVIPALDVRAALLAVRTGAADAGIVYASDALVEQEVAVLFEWPEACRPDVRYAAGVLHGAPHPEAAAAFLRFATAPARAALWQRYGFLPRPPAEPVPVL